MAAEHRLRVGHFAAAGGQRGVARIGAALLADVVQALGFNGQAEKLVFVVFHHARQIGAVQVFRRQRVVGGADAVLQRQIQAGGGFAAARDAHQDDVGFFEIFVGDAVVVVEREINRFHARVVALSVLRAADYGMAGAHAQFVFQLAEKGVEKAQVQAGAGFDDGADFIINDAGKHQRPHFVLFCGAVDNLHQRAGFVGGIDKGIGGALEFQAVKLLEQGVAHVFGSDAGAVGNEKRGAADGAVHAISN